jgi:hypothetical protein
MHEGNPAIGLERLRSERAVGRSAGQNHAQSPNRALALVLRHDKRDLRSDHTNCHRCAVQSHPQERTTSSQDRRMPYANPGSPCMPLPAERLTASLAIRRQISTPSVGESFKNSSALKFIFTGQTPLSTAVWVDWRPSTLRPWPRLGISVGNAHY